MKNIKWLFFDIGSTLIDETDCYKSRCDYAINKGGIKRDEFMALVYETAKTSPTAIKTAAEHYKIVLPEWDNSLEKLYPETAKVAVELSKKYHLGVIANQSLGTAHRLDNWGIGKYFDVIVASAEEGYVKPDLKIFELALKRADCKPEEAVMIGDRLDNDIVPAKKIGMKTIWVKQGLAKYQSINKKTEQPDYTINTISQLIELL